jgi:hypothetical protein
MISKPFTDKYAEQCSLIDPSKPIRIYRNLNASPSGEKGCWSVKQGTVKFHCRTIFLKNVTFLVNEKIRLRVVKNKRKEVHAFVMGEIIERPTFFTVDIDAQWIYYNPYKCSTFVTGNSPIYQACICALVKHGHTMKMAVDMISARYAKLMNKELDSQRSCVTMDSMETHLL